MKFAVVRVGGKQYLVTEKGKLKVDLKLGQLSETVELETLLRADGKTVEIGQPVLSSKVTATVVKQGKSKTVVVTKYKRKTRYKKSTGHRQATTELLISSL